MIFAREADRNADGEQQAEIGEDRIARRRDERDVEQIRLTEAQEKTRRR